ncbi:MAG: pitrilysin family protein, partial [bacterium]
CSIMITFRNGLRILIKPNRSNNILAMSAFVDTGSIHETEDESGLTRLTSRLLLKGTQRRSATDVAEEIESLGGDLEYYSTEDYSGASAIVTADEADAALDLLGDVLFNPVFPADELEKERRLTLLEIKRKEDDKFGYTYQEFRKILYAGHPYAKPAEGTPETVQEFRAEQLAEWHRAHFQPGNMILTVVGPVEPDEFVKKLEGMFGAERPAPQKRRVEAITLMSDRRTHELRKEIEQAFLCVGFLGPSALDEDYVALRVASAVLGEGMSSRFFYNLRDQHGLAYQIGCAIPARRGPGHVVGYIGTKPESLDAAREAMLAEMERLKTELVPDPELERAKNYIIGKYLIDHQTNARQGFYLGWHELLGLGVEHDQLYPALVEKITAEQVLAAAQKYFSEPTIVTLFPSSS